MKNGRIYLKLMSRSIGSMLAFVSGFFSLYPTLCEAGLTVSGNVARASGVFVSADFPISFINTPVDTVILESSFSGVAVDSGAILLRETDGATFRDMTVRLDGGARLVTQGTNFDGIFLNNRGNGSNTVLVEGSMEMVQRGVRFATDRSGAGEVDRVFVGEKGSIISGQTSIWLRHSNAPGLSLSGIEVDIAGVLHADTVRAIHISANGPDNQSAIVTRVRETGRVTAGEQAIYVGNAGSGRVIIDIAGEVIGGEGANLGLFGPTGAIIVDADEGDSTVLIRETGKVRSANERAVIDFDAGYNTDTSSRMMLENRGEITGMVDLGGGDDTFVNSGTWTLRNWTDSNGDGSRDTVGTAEANFGDGSDLFVNSGTVLVSAAARGGERAVFSGLERFENAGLLSAGDVRNGEARAYAGDVITISGSYIGRGGVVELDTKLGGDDSETDLLVVGGDVKGRSALLIQNAGGSGAFTDRGIRVVSVDGRSEDGAFFLAAPVEAGAHAYGLQEGNDEDWYLVRSGVSSMGAVYEAAPAVLLGSFGTVSTLEQRVGDRQALVGELDKDGGSWIRSTALRSDIAFDRSVSGVTVESDQWNFEFGYDFPVVESSSGTWTVGAYFSQGRTNATTYHSSSAGWLDADAAGFGLTATYRAAAGWYFDLQGALSWVETDMGSVNQGGLIDNWATKVNRFGFELGKRYRLSDGGTLVPQLQLSRSGMAGESFVDAQGNRVAFSAQEGWVARVGCAWELLSGGSGAGGSSPPMKLYLIGNVMHRLGDRGGVDLSGVSLVADREAWWAEVGIGATLSLGGNAMLYAEAARHVSFAGSDDATGADIGMRMHW